MTRPPTPAEIGAAADRVETFFARWDTHLGHTSTYDFVAAGPSEEDPDLTRTDLITLIVAARAAAEVLQAGRRCTATAPSAVDTQTMLTCVLPAEPAHEWHRTTYGAKWSPNAAAAAIPPDLGPDWEPGAAAADGEPAGRHRT